jgi:predicted unusual protein kinase regulating ubiquinone biosynthesis (AarF/ABC1/UbiB family)
MIDDPADKRGAPVPSGRGLRLLHMGGIVAGIAGGVIGGGLRQMAKGQRPELPNLLLTPSNALRLTNGLSHMRGAALKLGQMLSMDSGIVLSPQLTTILATLRDDARPMPPNQLRDVLNAEWGQGWLARFRKFDVRPFAAASIGQVHRAETRDGRLLAIKVQYPGVRTSIDSDVDNIATLMRLPGLLPKGMDVTPLLAAAKAQLREEADYTAEAAHLLRFSTLLAGSAAFVVPDLQDDLSTGQVLAMSFIESQPIDTLETAPQAVRDRVATDLIDLVLQELFTFHAMQTDPNFANYRVEPATGRIVLLDFGAVRPVDTGLAATFRSLLNGALDRDATAIRAAMLKIGYFGPETAPDHQDLIQQMFNVAMDPLRQDSAFDFGQSDLLDRLRDMGLALGTERDLMHVPPAETLFLHRKIGGMYLLATRLRARVNLRQLADRYR